MQQYFVHTSTKLAKFSNRNGSRLLKKIYKILDTDTIFHAEHYFLHDSKILRKI